MKLISAMGIRAINAWLIFVSKGRSRFKLINNQENLLGLDIIYIYICACLIVVDIDTNELSEKTYKPSIKRNMQNQFVMSFGVMDMGYCLVAVLVQRAVVQSVPG